MITNERFRTNNRVRIWFVVILNDEFFKIFVGFFARTPTKFLFVGIFDEEFLKMIVCNFKRTRTSFVLVFWPFFIVRHNTILQKKKMILGIKK